MVFMNTGRTKDKTKNSLDKASQMLLRKHVHFWENSGELQSKKRVTIKRLDHIFLKKCPHEKLHALKVKSMNDSWICRQISLSTGC